MRQRQLYSRSWTSTKKHRNRPLSPQVFPHNTILACISLYLTPEPKTIIPKFSHDLSFCVYSNVLLLSPSPLFLSPSLSKNLPLTRSPVLTTFTLMQRLSLLLQKSREESLTVGL